MSTPGTTAPLTTQAAHFSDFLTELSARHENGGLVSDTPLVGELPSARKKLEDYGVTEVSSALGDAYEAVQNGSTADFCNRPLTAYSTDGKWRVQRTALSLQDNVANGDIPQRGRLSVGYTQFWHPRPAGAVDAIHHLVMTDADRSIVGLLEGTNGLIMLPGKHSTLVTGIQYFLTPTHALRFGDLSSKHGLIGIAKWLFEQQFGAAAKIAQKKMRGLRNEPEAPQWVEDTAQVQGGVFVAPYTPSFAPTSRTSLLIGIVNYTGDMLPLRRPLWPALCQDNDSVSALLTNSDGSPAETFVTLQKDLNRAVAALITEWYAGIPDDRVRTLERLENLAGLRRVLSD